MSDAAPDADASGARLKVSSGVGESAGHRHLVLGLAVVLLMALAARLAAAVVPVGVSEVAIGLILGLLLANLLGLPHSVATGAGFAATRLLRLGIVLLGARLDLADVAAVGAEGLLAVVVAMLLAFVVALGVGRLLGLPSTVRLLVGVGTAICGNSAIAATAPVIEARPRDVGLAMAVITLFGTLAVVVYPVIGHALSLPDTVFGSWAGIAVSDTAQATAAGFAYSSDAGEMATVVKLIRNSALGPVVVLISVWWAASGAGGQVGTTTAGGVRVLLRAVPVFMVGFVGMVLANTAGLIPEPIQPVLGEAAGLLILVALVGVGLTTDLNEMRRLGARVVLLGFLAIAGTSLFALGALSLWHA